MRAYDETHKVRLPKVVEDLTAEWFSHALRDRLDGDAVKGVEIVRIIPGTATKVTVQLDYYTDSDVVPRQVCVKGGFDTALEDFGIITVWEREVDFFTHVAPELDARLLVRRPKLRHGRAERADQADHLLRGRVESLADPRQRRPLAEQARDAGWTQPRRSLVYPERRSRLSESPFEVILCDDHGRTVRALGSELVPRSQLGGNESSWTRSRASSPHDPSMTDGLAVSALRWPVPRGWRPQRPGGCSRLSTVHTGSPTPECPSPAASHRPAVLGGTSGWKRTKRGPHRPGCQILMDRPGSRSTISFMTRVNWTRSAQYERAGRSYGCAQFKPSVRETDHPGTR